jgi:hypothetical protein
VVFNPFHFSPPEDLMRQFSLLALAATLFLFASSPSVTVADEKSKGGDAHASGYEECAKACSDCQRLCDMCAAHCAKLIAEGKKDHLTTLRTCQDCATHCSAAACIVSRMGPFSDTICTACAEACKRCGDACEKHSEDSMMKRCAEECRKCEKACREMLKHTGEKK